MPLRWIKTALLPVAIVFATAAWGLPLRPRVDVDFHHKVIVNSETLPPGHYVFQEVATKGTPRVFRVTTPQGKNLTLTSIAITTEASPQASGFTPPAANKTEVVLQKIGGKYYLHKIWIQGRTYGWEFNIPEHVKSQVAEMNEEVLPGNYSADNGQGDMQSNASGSEYQSAIGTGNANIDQVSSVTGCLMQGSSPNDYYVRSANGERTEVVPGENLRNEMASQTNHEVRLVTEWPQNTPIAAHLKNTSASWSNTAANSKQTARFQADRIDVIALSCR